VALDIGLETIRRECQMFNRWIERLESLAWTQKIKRGQIVFSYLYISVLV
jgi:hypothetical protein